MEDNKKIKVLSVNSDRIEFENGIVLFFYHEQSCCEDHYLSLDDLIIEDFEGLELDLSGDDFFKKIEGYGIELIPIHGHTVRIPGYGNNNGYYSDNLSIIISDGKTITKEYDISECQEY